MNYKPKAQQGISGVQVVTYSAIVLSVLKRDGLCIPCPPQREDRCHNYRVATWNIEEQQWQVEQDARFHTIRQAREAAYEYHVRCAEAWDFIP